MMESRRDSLMAEPLDCSRGGIECMHLQPKAIDQRKFQGDVLSDPEAIGYATRYKPDCTYRPPTCSSGGTPNLHEMTKLSSK